MRFVVLSVLVGLTGCDLNEGPREETREANEAVRDGDRPGEIRDQVEDIGARRDGVVVKDNDPDFDRELRDAEQWAEKQRQGLDEAGRQVDEAYEKTLDEIQADLKKIRADVDKLGTKPEGEREGVRENLREQLRTLSLKIDKLDGEVDDQPGKDPMGPG